LSKHIFLSILHFNFNDFQFFFVDMMTFLMVEGEKLEKAREKNKSKSHH
jgi:hypothetical protein